MANIIAMKAVLEQDAILSVKGRASSSVISEGSVQTILKLISLKKVFARERFVLIGS